MGINSVVNKEITILGYKIGKSKYKENTNYITVQFEYADKRYVFFTGSGVIEEQLRKYEDKLPFVTTVQKINRYYTLT